MKKFTFLLFLIIPTISFAQVDFGSPTASAMGGAVTASAKDWEAVGINPANLGYKNNLGLSISIMNVGVCFTDEGLTLPEIRNLASNTGALTDDSTQAGTTARQQILRAFTAPGGLNLNTRANLLSFSFAIPKIGGFAINLTDEVYTHLELGVPGGTLATDIMGTDFTDIFSVASLVVKDSNYLKDPNKAFAGSSAGGYYYRELNFDYGRKILTIKTNRSGDGGASYENSEYQSKSKKSDTTSSPVEIFFGGGFKPVWGLAAANLPADGSAGAAELTYLSNLPSSAISFPFHANGRGYGVDLGLSATYKKWKMGVSAIDLGKVTYQNNTLYTPNLRPNVTNDSIVNQLISAYKENGLGDVAKYLYSQSIGPNYTTALPSKFRSGISYELSKGISFSSDFVAPLNSVEGNILNPYFVVGTHINFFHIFAFSVGYATEKEFGNIVPVGLFINMGGAEIYASTNDITAFLNQNNSHVISGSFGIRVYGFN